MEAGSVPQTAVYHDSSSSLSWRSPSTTAFEVASMKSLKGKEEDKKEIIDAKYQRLINKYPEILTPSFNDLSTKHGVTHRIRTGDSQPFKSKPRPLLANSEKAIKGKEAWGEMIRLGVVEKVHPNAVTDWAAPLHLVPKPCGGMRPCSDFRQLNSRTVPDAYPIPSLKSFTSKLHGSKIFSKVDLQSAFHNVVIDSRDVKKTTTLTPCSTAASITVGGIQGELWGDWG